MSTPSSFPPRRSAPAALIASLRPRQWVKNFFVLAPLVFSKHLVDPLFALRAGIAMLIFCALSGAVYAFNDVHDIDDDRRHPLKRYRPIAAGELSTRRALWLSGCLVALALGGAALMNPLLLAVAAAYVVNNLAYSLWLKKIAFVDVLLISVGFLLRVLGGAYAIHVPISVWLLACTGLLAAFLGFGKRAHELLSARRLERDAAATRPALRGYDPSTLHLVPFYPGTRHHRDLRALHPRCADGPLLRHRRTHLHAAFLRRRHRALPAARPLVAAAREPYRLHLERSILSRQPRLLGRIRPLHHLRPPLSTATRRRLDRRRPPAYKPSMAGEEAISERKRDHLEIAASGRANHRGSTLLDDVHLVHQSLPELSLDEIDLSTELLGHRLRAPLLITGMTGGTAEAERINRDIAGVADSLGIAFGVGSQRALAEHPEWAASYAVREEAPDVFLLGNIGAVQAKDYGVARVAELVASIDADALAVHLNPAQEAVQDGGDRDFRGQLDAIAALAAGLEVPILVKETGCGLSAEAAAALVRAGVSAVDVAGAGGTSWTAVESERAAMPAGRRLGEEFRSWGVPTAVSTALCVAAGLEVVASGGIRRGTDIARALALGARCGGMAAPVLRAQREGGADAVRAHLEELIAALRVAMLLVGAANLESLQRAPRHIGGELRAWLADLGGGPR